MCWKEGRIPKDFGIAGTKKVNVLTHGVTILELSPEFGL
jgi:hypothetical protein